MVKVLGFRVGVGVRVRVRVRPARRARRHCLHGARTRPALKPLTLESPSLTIQAPSPWAQLTAAFSRPPVGVGSQGAARPARGSVREA